QVDGRVRRPEPDDRRGGRGVRVRVERDRDRAGRPELLRQRDRHPEQEVTSRRFRRRPRRRKRRSHHQCLTWTSIPPITGTLPMHTTPSRLRTALGGLALAAAAAGGMLLVAAVPTPAAQGCWRKHPPAVRMIPVAAAVPA